jgi:hypothetical protein
MFRRKIKDVEFGRVCGTQEMHSGFDGGNMKERGRLEDLAVDGRIILKLP